MSDRSSFPESSLPPPKESEKSGLVAQRRSISFSSPFPPPAILKEYEEVCPGAMARLLDIAERQQDTDIKLRMADSQRQDAIVACTAKDVSNEELLIKTNGDNIHYAIRKAFYLGIGAIAGACVCAWLGHPFLGGSLGIAGLASIVTAFVQGAHLGRGEITDISKQKKKKK